jgi:hypothetical protein
MKLDRFDRSSFELVLSPARTTATTLTRQMWRWNLTGLTGQVLSGALGACAETAFFAQHKNGHTDRVGDDGDGDNLRGKCGDGTSPL